MTDMILIKPLPMDQVLAMLDESTGAAASDLLRSRQQVEEYWERDHRSAIVLEALRAQAAAAEGAVAALRQFRRRLESQGRYEAEQAAIRNASNPANFTKSGEAVSGR